MIVKLPAVLSGDIHFEPALDEDFEQLLALRIEAMRESLENIGRFDVQRARDRFLSSFSASDTRHIVFDGLRVGFFAVKRLADFMVLDHLYVKPQYQGRGVGALVLNHIFVNENMDQLPIRVGALRGSDSNRFYAKHGFVMVEEDEWDIYYVRSVS